MDRAELLLDGPVGLVAMSALVLDGHPTGVAMGYDMSPLRDQIRFRAVLAERVAVRTSELVNLAHRQPHELLALLAETVGGYHHGYGPQGHTLMPALASCRDLLIPIAQALAAVPALAWWWEPSGDRQFITETAEGTNTDRVPTYDTGTAWWVTPWAARTVQTTRGPVGLAPSVTAVCAEDTRTRTPRTAPFPTPPGKVIEIAHPRDWVALVEEQPHPWTDRHGEWAKMTGHPGPWVGPDWNQVAAHATGVHVTFAAYLATAYRPLAAAGASALLTGWDPDATVWLGQEPHAIATAAPWLGE